MDINKINFLKSQVLITYNKWKQKTYIFDSICTEKYINFLHIKMEINIKNGVFLLNMHTKNIFYNKQSKLKK